jgi:hypothetical protein
LWTLRDDRRALVRVLAYAAAGVVPFGLLVLAYNQARWGSPLITGYGLETVGDPTRRSFFGEQIGVGLLGLFLSPGKSVFLFCPPLVASAFAWPRFYRRAPAAFWAMVLTVAPVVLVCSRLLAWAGDYAWGPRYLVFAVPVLLLPLAGLLDDVRAMASRARRRLATFGLAGVFAWGLVVQIAGISFFWDHYIRITMQVRERWLGAPDRRGAAVPAREGLCGSCFEDMHGLDWLPPFQAINGHLWLLRHVPFADPWEVAAQDAPWRRYTGLALPPVEGYAGARLDWWFLELWPVSRACALALLLAFAGGLGGAGVVLAGELRRVPGARGGHLEAET